MTEKYNNAIKDIEILNDKIIDLKTQLAESLSKFYNLENLNEEHKKEI